MSGAAFSRMQRDILKRIPTGPTEAQLYVFSDSAAQCHIWKKHEWREAYNFPLTEAERARITDSIKTAITASSLYAGIENTARILDRETSVAFTALKEGASRDEKRAWDPDGKKRGTLIELLRSALPEYEVLIGGKTTVDVTKKGMTKAYGVRWLATELHLAPSDMLFIGDGFYEGGNDAIVIPTGIQIKEVHSPQETEMIVDESLKTIS
jgi:hydroxymethylpyrimidine pyrophosphatase-like HAD family hydrolase